jgi:simple sugar transport system permease protein
LIDQRSAPDPARAETDSARPSRLRALLGGVPTLAALLLIVLTIGGAAVASGSSPGSAFVALWQGAFGDVYALSETLTFTTPLLFTGLGVAIAFRSGVWNIGAEGQFIVGAMASVALLRLWTPSAAWIGTPSLLLAGALAGAVWGFLPAVLLIYRRVPEVISTIMLNFVAIQLLSWSIRGPLQETARRYPQSDPIPDSLHLWRFLPPTRLHAGFFLALMAMAGLYLLLKRTVLGFQIRATGQNARAARYAGIPTRRAILASMAIGGALAGLGGAVELTGVTFRLFEPFSPGYGYTAIAVALLGGLQPYLVGAAALLFGALNAGSGSLQRAAGVPSVLVSVIQAVILFFVAWRNARQRT